MTSFFENSSALYIYIFFFSMSYGLSFPCGGECGFLTRCFEINNLYESTRFVAKDVRGKIILRDRSDGFLRGIVLLITNLSVFRELYMGTVV